MTISLRVKGGWKKKEYSKQAKMEGGYFICPVKKCGAQLFMAPHGGVYCDKEHAGKPD